MSIHNEGIMNVGNGVQDLRNVAVGHGASVHIGQQDARRDTAALGDTWHFGIVTVLPKETKAVIDVLGLRDDGSGGQRFYTGRFLTQAGASYLVATQPTGPGQRPIMAALTNLRERYDPAVIVLVGIAGVIHTDVALNDVAISTRVVYYDSRKNWRGRTVRRGQELVAPAALTHSVNAFFTAAGDPASLPGFDGSTGGFRVFHGPIGSGEAVLADPDDDIRRFLTDYNDKTLAVEMEAGGLAQFCHDTTTRRGDPLGWVVVRGMSDRADEHKDDHHHDSAAVNAAQAFKYLIPYIRPRL